jgi:transposase
MSTVTVLPGPERRRRWTTGEKLRIVEESFDAGISVVEFARQRDLHPNLVHTWRWQARKGMLTRTSGGEAHFAPVAMVAAGDAMRPIASEAKGASGASAVEVVLRNGRVLRLPENVTPAHAARLADALETGGR